MKLFVDNDIAVKLAQWGLLQRFSLHMTKQGGADIFMVPTLRWKFKLDEPVKALQLLGTPLAVQQLTDFTKSCKPAKGHNAVVAAELSGIPSIDAGEAALFAAAAQFDTALIDTGDKKALRALGGLGPAHVVNQNLAMKIACLEQTVHYLIGRWTFDAVSRAVMSAPQADQSTRDCFEGRQETDCLAALHAKVESLRPHCAGTLATGPFNWIA
jgi:hypothetical protein